MRKFCNFALLFVVIVIIGGLAVTLTSCSEASKVNANISKQADYFETMRRITVYNARTDTIIFECEGLLSITNDSYDELVITAKLGPSQYKKNYVYLNDNVLYAVEDINGTYTDPYHYKWYWHTEVLPSIEVKP